MFIKKIIAILFVLTLSMYSIAYANETQQIKKVEQQRKAIKLKINSLKRLEKQEVNRLSKNQQKLEKNQQTLKQSKKKYTKKQQNINALQKELDSYLVKYNKRQSASAERIRCIYKTKHTLILDLLISTNSLSQFLDRIYYQNLIIESDRKRMTELRTQSNEIAAIKRKLEQKKRQRQRKCQYKRNNQCK